MTHTPSVKVGLSAEVRRRFCGPKFRSSIPVIGESAAKLLWAVTPSTKRALSLKFADVSVPPNFKCQIYELSVHGPKFIQRLSG